MCSLLNFASKIVIVLSCAEEKEQSTQFSEHFVFHVK